VSGLDVIDGKTQIKVTNVGRAVVEIAQFIDAQKNELLDLHVQRPSLEDVFIELTGSSLRD
jgi:ABC-2 type transport system ATP-binding protein